jgi:hypothetical protein
VSTFSFGEPRRPPPTPPCHAPAPSIVDPPPHLLPLPRPPDLLSSHYRTAPAVHGRSTTPPHPAPSMEVPAPAPSIEGPAPSPIPAPATDLLSHYHGRTINGGSRARYRSPLPLPRECCQWKVPRLL